MDRPLGFGRNVDLLLVDQDGQVVSCDSNTHEIKNPHIRGGSTFNTGYKLCAKLSFSPPWKLVSILFIKTNKGQGIWTQALLNSMLYLLIEWYQMFADLTKILAYFCLSRDALSFVFNQFIIADFTKILAYFYLSRGNNFGIQSISHLLSFLVVYCEVTLWKSGVSDLSSKESEEYHLLL